MKEERISPFQLNRWETEDSRHFYFLDTSDYRKIRDSRKHCFVVGHRGTGKTSLLKALSWKERTSNANLLGLPGSDPFSDGVVGCYFGLQYLHIDTLDQWVKEASPEIAHEILGSYFRGLWLEEAAKATSTLRDRSGIAGLNTEMEVLREVADEVEQWLPTIIRSQIPAAPEGFLSLRRVRDMAACLTAQLYRMATDFNSDPGDTVATLNLHRLAELTNALFSAMARLLPQGNGPAWAFQMCIDEGEYLSERGRRTIRTLVRECRSPLLMTVASLDDLGVETINERVRLTVHDRLLLDLRKRSLRQFMDLLNGIVNERLKAFAPLKSSFDVGELLGSFNLNELLLRATPERPESRRQINAWKARWELASENEWSPIREYLLGSETSSAPADRIEARALDSAGYRKKFVAAYLKLLATLGVKEPVYAGAPIALRMMENSLRDAFMFLEGCFQSSTTPGRGGMPKRVAIFIERRPVSIQNQNAALKSVAVQKMHGLDGRLVTLTTVSRSLVEFLSRLSNRLDMDPATTVIAVPERTTFVFDIPASSTNLEQRREQNARTSAIVESLQNCSREGYLVGGVDPSNPRQLLVRVNRSLAKLHGFSYRMPQYQTRLRWDYLDEIAIASDKLDIEGLANRAASEVVGVDGRRVVGTRRATPETSLSVPLFDDLGELS